MIALARGSVGAARATGAVFFREALRTARRWQTYGLRAGFSAVLLGALLLVWHTQLATIDVASLSLAGRRLFLVYAYVQLLLVGLLSPLLVGSGILEEREDRTLEILAITRLGPRQILWGKVLSRVLVLVMVIFGSLPAFALSMTFGGVASWELVNALVNTLVVVVVLGFLGGFVSLFARGGLAPVLFATLYAIVAFLFFPVLFVLLANLRETELGWFSPVFAVMDPSPRGLLPIVVFAPVLWLLVRWSGPVFAMITSDDDDPTRELGELSAEFWTFERYKSRAGIVGLLALLTSPFVALVGLSSRRYIHAPLGVDLSRAVVFVWMVLLLYSTTALMLLWGVTVARRVQGLISVGGLSALWSFRPKQRVARPARLPVWPNPVAWRELVTRAFGATNTLAWLVVALWMACVSMLYCAGALRSGTGVMMGIPAVVLGQFLAVVVATQSMVEDRRSGNLELLATTTFRPLSILVGKGIAATGVGGPLVALGWALVALDVSWRSMSQLGRDGPGIAVYYCDTDGLLPTAPVLGIVCVGVWAAAYYGFAVVAAMLVSLVVRASRIAWGVNVAGAVAMWIAPPLLYASVRGNRVLEWGCSVLMPLLDGATWWSFCGANAAQVTAAVGWSAGTAVLTLALVLGMRRWAARGER